MGGEETIQKLLEIDPKVKAIVSSAYSKHPIMSEFNKYGFKGVIAKPYKIEKLSEIIYKVLKEKEKISHSLLVHPAGSTHTGVRKAG